VKKHQVTLLGFIVLVSLWAGPQTAANARSAAKSKIRADRGLNFSHKEHFKHKKMKCTDCHDDEFDVP